MREEQQQQALDLRLFLYLEKEQEALFHLPHIFRLPNIIRAYGNNPI